MSVPGTVSRAAAAARWVLVGVGGVFVLSGLVVSALNLFGALPRGYGWQGPVFLALGLAGMLTAWMGLPGKALWPSVLLAVVYLPWTVIGLLGDARTGLWALAAGEAGGLLAALWALGVGVREWMKARDADRRDRA